MTQKNITVAIDGKDNLSPVISRINKSIQRLKGSFAGYSNFAKKAETSVMSATRGIEKGRVNIASMSGAIADSMARNKGWKSSYDRNAASMRKSIPIIKSVGVSIQKTGKQALTFGKQLSATSRPFQGWAMSMMFAGMAMMRYMSLIWKSSTKVFQDVMHSVEGTSTSFDVLNGQMKYMSFVAGEALAPLAEQLVPLIAWLAQWIADNEEIFRGMVKWGFIIGTAFFAAGQLGLAIMGIVEAVEKLGIVFNYAFKNMKQGLINLKGNVLYLKYAFQGMNTASKIGFVGVVAGIILALTWIWKLGEAMGGVMGFLKGLASGLIRVFTLIGDVIVTALMTPLQYVLALVARAMDWLGMGQPKWITDFVNFKSTMATDFLKHQQDTGFLENDQGWAQGGGMVPTFNISNVNVTSDNVDGILQEITDLSRNGA